MKVILLKDVKNIGKINQVVEVSDGYAKNYLLPNKLAVSATDSALQKNQKIKAEELKDNLEKIEYCQKIKKQLATVTLEFKLKVNDDKASGAISAKQIATSLLDDFHIEIDKHKFLNFKPINKIGISEVQVKLMPEIIAKFNVKISGE